MTNGESVLEIFKNALHHYDKVLRELKNSKELEGILAMIEEDIHKNLDNNTSLITQIDSPNGLIIVENNRRFLCGCLRKLFILSRAYQEFHKYETGGRLFITRIKVDEN
jgi:FPC/CPF motif-containing protein YcgG